MESTTTGKRPQPKPRSIRGLSGHFDKDESLFDTRFSTECAGVDLRNRARSLDYREKSNPTPRRSKSVRHMSSVSAVSSSPASYQSSQSKCLSLEPTSLVGTQMMDQLAVSDSRQNITPRKVELKQKTESPKPKKKENVLVRAVSPLLKKSSFFQRQRAYTEPQPHAVPRSVTREKPKPPPPYVPKKRTALNQFSTTAFQSRTSPVRHGSTQPQRKAPPPPASISPIPTQRKTVPNPTPRYVKMPHECGSAVQGCSTVTHDYESVDNPHKVELSSSEDGEAAQSSSNYEPIELATEDEESSNDEELDASSSNQTGGSPIPALPPKNSKTKENVPALPPRSIPRPAVQKHRLLTQPNSQRAFKMEEHLQDNTEKCDVSDSESDDSYTDMSGGLNLPPVSFEDDNIYIEMNPTEFIQPPKSYIPRNPTPYTQK